MAFTRLQHLHLARPETIDQPVNEFGKRLVVRFAATLSNTKARTKTLLCVCHRLDEIRAKFSDIDPETRIN